MRFSFSVGKSKARPHDGVREQLSTGLGVISEDAELSMKLVFTAGGEKSRREGGEPGDSAPASVSKLSLGDEACCDVGSPRTDGLLVLRDGELRARCWWLRLAGSGVLVNQCPGELERVTRVVAGCLR